MRIENANASDVLERILSAYGFTMQKELAERLEIAKSNVAGWLQRGQIPGNVIVQCALDTGADVNWIVTGELAKANLGNITSVLQGKALYDEILSNGGRTVLRRIMDAYGFTLQKQLCDLLEISSGTVSTWVRRDYFPGDVVVACAIDTGASLLWLATGKEEPTGTQTTGISSNKIPKYRLESGRLKELGLWSADLTLFNTTTCNAEFIEGVEYSWLIDRSQNELGTGRWLIIIDGAFEIFDIARLPGGKLRLTNSSIIYECSVDDVKPYGAVLYTLQRHI